MTSVSIRFSRNRSSAPDIQLHLTVCSDRFVPPLSGRVDVPAYAAKLAHRAERFEAWSDTCLVGLVALYCPPEGPAPVPSAFPVRDGQRHVGEAFISNVSVMPAHLRQGIARHLLADAIAHCRGRAARIALKVDRRAAALRLYRSSGFAIEGAEDDTLTLGLSLV